MSGSLVRLISMGSALVCTGCMSAAVFDYRGDDPAPRAPTTLPAGLAVNDVAFPQTRTEVVNPNTSATERFGEVRFIALEERLTELLARSDVTRVVRRSRDLPREGIASPGFVVLYRVLSYSSSASDDAAGVFAGIVGTILTAGITGGALVFTATRRHEHVFEIEVRLYRVEDSQLVSVRAAASGDLVAQYDTAGATLLWRTTRQLTIRSGHCMACAPSGTEANRFHRQEGRQMARVIFDETAGALRQQMQRSLAARPAARPEPVATAGGDSAEAFESIVRARLDERATRILLCTNSESALLLVEWSGAGHAAVQVRNATDEVVGCVRAAVGDLAPPSGTPAGRVLHAVSR